MGSYLASTYQYLYLAFVSIVTLGIIGRYKRRQSLQPVSLRSNKVFGVFLLAIMILFIGFRPVSGYFVDMSTYSLNLERLHGETFYFTTDTDNLLFDNLFIWWGCKGYSSQLFFLLISAIYFGCVYIGVKRLFPNHILIAYIVFLGAFSTFSYATNGIKAGAAASIFIMALGYIDRLWICIPIMLVSLGFHHSMVLPIAAFIVTIVIKNPRWYYWGWVICFLLALFHITYFQELFGSIADDQGSLYLLATEDTTEAHMGFRPDFILYSAIPVLLGYQFEIKRKALVSSIYKILTHLYLTINAVWMLCMYASFTNRIAYLSWFLYPILIIYPFLYIKKQDPSNNVKLRKIVLYHLGFTLFMYIVYYGLLSLGR